MRIARPQSSDLTLLQSKTFSTAGRDFHHETLHIFAENTFANVYKQKMLEAINYEMCVVPATDILPKTITSQKIKEALDRNQTDTGGLASVIKIKVNSRVMLTVNVDLSDRLVNGQLGTVKHISKNLKGEVTKIYIKFDDAGAGQKKVNKDTFAKQHSWVPVEKYEADIKLKANSYVVIKRTQFLIGLVWACTVHKVQGLSLPKIVVSFDLHRQRNFNYGQIYVALSRVTSLEGLYITGSVSAAAMKANLQAMEEYNRIRLESALMVDEVKESKGYVLFIVLLNIQSLSKHVLDLKRDQSLEKSDILCLTEM